MLTDEQIRALRDGCEGVTPGPWDADVDDTGGQWSGWPISICATSITDKTIVRPGGMYPYEWDAKTSQYEANRNAAHIARCDPQTIAAICTRVLEAETRVKVLENALRPFAIAYKLPDGAESDPMFVDFVNARAALEEALKDPL